MYKIIIIIIILVIVIILVILKYYNLYIILILLLLLIILLIIKLFYDIKIENNLLNKNKNYKGGNNMALQNKYKNLNMILDNNKDKKFLTQIFPKINNIYINIIKKFLDKFKKEDIGQIYYKYTQTIPKLKYTEDIKFINFNCHLGQRKLLLTEIEFYSKYYNIQNKNTLVVYVGSASLEHQPIISKLFPKLKFLLIDPNYHSLGSDNIFDTKYKYIYQNTDVININNYNIFLKHLKKINYINKRNDHLRQTTKTLKNVKFLFKKKTYDVLQTYKKKDKDMDNIKKQFENINYNNLINKIMEDPCKIFIIQDYMTIKLTELIKKSINIYKKNNKSLNLLFLTDIRTNMFDLGNGAPSDLDILWNYALQVIFLKKLRPAYSMLKFRPPFFNDYKSPKMEHFINLYKNNFNIQNTQNTLYNTIINDFKYVNKYYNLDLIQNYQNKQFYYFDNIEILLQPWSPINSTETRLFISVEIIDNNYILYDNYKWEDTFYYLNLLRNFKYYNLFNIFLKNNKFTHYNNCYDCTRELLIIGEYFYKTSNNFEKKENHLDDTTINNILNIINNKKYYNNIKEIYNNIKLFTYFDLSEYNYKCPFHHMMKIKQNKFIINFIYNKKLYGININIDNIKNNLDISDIVYIYNINTNISDKFMNDIIYKNKQILINNNSWHINLQ